jgi:excisionase family DNA binding protein
MLAAKLIKVPEVAELLALSEKTVWAWIGARRISVVRPRRSRPDVRS